MPRLICILLVLATPLLLAADTDDEVRKELQALQGRWKAVALEAGGKPLPKEAVPEFMFIIGPGGKSTAKMANSEYTATITVDPMRNPKSIDNLHESGSQQGKKQYGVYKLESGNFIVCITQPGVAEADRPKNFDTTNTANVVFVFELVQDDAK